ncbi:MAG: SUF system NifU family Fe-S cluster assembly protein [Gemmatimonadota bacterium]|nr:SUF system NifU family Fe-S cluster assembly protein [Gemmatimonadota bacterium]
MESPSIGSLYQDLILEHYRRPRNQGELPDRTADVHVANPVCGDEIRLQLKIAGGIIEQARFVGSGCSISQASASMMTSLLEGRSLTDAEALAKRFGDMMRGDADAARDRRLGDLRALQGVSKFPVRIKCAMLGFDALRKPLEHNSAISGGP